MLGPGVIVAEGITEQAALLATAEKLESDTSCYPLDLSGVTIFPVEGDGSMPMFGAFFRALGIRAYAFYDKKPRTAKETQAFFDSFDVPVETPYQSMERLLVTEIPVDRQWQFLDELRQAGEQGQVGVPSSRPADAQVPTLTEQALKSNKGNAYDARLIEYCDVAEMPPTIVTFLMSIYLQFPRPTPLVSVADVGKAAPSQSPPQGGGEPSDNV